MTDLPPLDGLSHEEKNALILGLWQEQQRLLAEIEKLQPKQVKKTTRNSSLPPSKGFKPNQSRSESVATASRHRTGGRPLSAHPHQVVVAQATTCPHCAARVATTSQQMTGCYERIDLPPVEPYITRVERYGDICPHCQQRYESPVPVGLEPGSPFGPRLASVVTGLRYGHAVSYQRLRQLLVFENRMLLG